MLESPEIVASVSEALRLGGPVSNNQRRFMNSAKQNGKNMEPLGPMAGSTMQKSINQES
jgi:hypothetical protein